MSKYYKLVNKKPKPCTLQEWGDTFGNRSRRVADDKINGVTISTVFLGLDHNFNDFGPPLLFETMIFGGEHNDYQERCSTWEQAEAMHAQAVKLVKGEK